MKNKLKVLQLIGYIFLAASIYILNLYLQSVDLTHVFYSVIVIGILHVVFKIMLEEAVLKSVEESKARYTLKKTLEFLEVLLLILILIKIWAINIQNVLVLYGLITAGVAISLQDFFRNFVGGIVILTSRLYEVGDRIEVDDEFGDIIDIGLFYTTMMEIRNWVDGDQATGRITHLPNSAVLEKSINNYTKDHSFIWDEIMIPLTYESDWLGAKKEIEELIKKRMEKVSDQATQELTSIEKKYYMMQRRVEPQVLIEATDNYVKLIVRYIADVRNRRLTKSELTEVILNYINTSKRGKLAFQTITIHKE